MRKVKRMTEKTHQKNEITEIVKEIKEKKIMCKESIQKFIVMSPTGLKEGTSI